MINYSMIEMPNPYEGPAINAYLINHDPITLIDCGFNNPECMSRIKEQLTTQGLKLSDVKRILVSHAHSDHFGLAAEIQRNSGCKVFMHPDEMARAVNYIGYLHQHDSYHRYAGLSEPMYKKLLDYHKWESGYIEVPEEIIAVEDRQLFAFDGFELEAVSTPGHSSGHLCFYQKEEKLLFSGDMFMEKVIPNPLVDFFQNGNRQKGLMQIADSFEHLKTLEINQVLPGHGKYFNDTEACYKWISLQFRKRKEKISKITANLGTFTPVDVAVEIYRDLTSPVICVFAVNEILGYLDFLEADGTVMPGEREGRLVYSYVK